MPLWLREVLAGVGASALLVGLSVVGSLALLPALGLSAGAYLGLRLLIPTRSEPRHATGSSGPLLGQLERTAARFEELAPGIPTPAVAEDVGDLARLTRDLVPRLRRSTDALERSRVFLEMQLPRALQLVERYAWLVRQPYLGPAARDELEAAERTISLVEKALEEQHRRILSEDVREFSLDRRVFEELLHLDARLETATEHEEARSAGRTREET